MSNVIRVCKVLVDSIYAGILRETDEGYEFEYDKEYTYLYSKPVSLTLPISDEVYFSHTLFSFFDGLIPEGWLLNIVTSNWKINPKDRFGLLLIACKDPIGNVSIEEMTP